MKALLFACMKPQRIVSDHLNVFTPCQLTCKRQPAPLHRDSSHPKDVILISVLTHPQSFYVSQM